MQADNTVSISNGNIKTGDIRSASVSPQGSCNPNLPCWAKCYANRMVMRWTSKTTGTTRSVAKSWANNLRIFNENPDDYFEQIAKASAIDRYFRWHVGGDIVNSRYFKGMIDVANRNPGTSYLVFTKKYYIVNSYVEKHGIDSIPKNLIILFSEWEGYPLVNPHEFPVVHCILKGRKPSDDWKICGGSCMDCICKGVGCWELKHGEHLGIYEH